MYLNPIQYSEHCIRHHLLCMVETFISQFYQVKNIANYTFAYAKF